MKTVIVLGGYGSFGKKIVENLSAINDLILFVAGRNSAKAKTCISHLQANAKARLQPLVIDINADDFTKQLAVINPFLVIHTCGPFQGQDYKVAQACIEVGAHYIDLADDRRFVCDIDKLDTQAKAKKVLVVSGASSVPGLSSAVIEHYQAQLSVINTIDLAIAPGNKAERGLATVQAILSYTGHAMLVFKNARWQKVYGWMDTKRTDFGDIVGKRYLANVDVPDLEIFPERYQVQERVSFQAGLELAVLHYAMKGMAHLAKANFVKNWASFAKPIVQFSNVFLPFGTDKGAMEVKITGLDKNNKAKTIIWHLYAAEGNGPYIPTFSSMIVAKKLLNNTCQQVGAIPCVGLFELSDFEPYFQAFNIYFKAHTS